MAVAILTAVFVLLVVGLVVAVWAAARARRKFPLAFKPAPWSSDELDGLSSDLTDLGGPDPDRGARSRRLGRQWGPLGAEARDLPGAASRGCVDRRPRAGRQRERRLAGRRPRGRRRISSGPGPRPRCVKAGDQERQRISRVRVKPENGVSVWRKPRGSWRYGVAGFGRTRWAVTERRALVLNPSRFPGPRGVRSRGSLRGRRPCRSSETRHRSCGVRYWWP
jgi:hypothetical protein